MSRTPTVRPGDKYGLWTVVELNVGYSGQRPGNNVKDLLRCECGLERQVARHNYKAGRSKSCGRTGCYQQITGKRRGNPSWAKHGKSGTRIHKSWVNMRKITRETSPAHAYYWDRGIGVFVDWDTDFQAFYDYVIENLGEPQPTDRLSRIDTSKGFEPGNIMWKARKEPKRRKGSEDYKRFGPESEPTSNRLRPVHVPPHLKRKGWTS